MSMAISLNGEHRELSTRIFLAEALADWGYVQEEVAVAVNGEFIPRQDYDTRRLDAGDCVEVVGPVQGG